MWERKYELDSGAYFLNLLWNYHHTPGVTQSPQHSPLFEPSVTDAILLMLKVGTEGAVMLLGLITIDSIAPGRSCSGAH